MPPADTVPGAQDHPLLSRYAGSRLVGYQVKDYDSTPLVAGRIKKNAGRAGESPFEKTLQLEGRITRIAYNFSIDRSGLEVMRNYRNAIQAAGMSIVFACEKDACGQDFGQQELGLKLMPGSDPGIQLFQGATQYWSPFNYGRMTPHYVLASAQRDGATTYAAVYIVDPVQGHNGGVYVEIVEPVPMETGKVTVDLSAQQMADRISAEGKVALYGLYFDTDKAELRPDSKPTLEQMAKLLRQEPALQVFIVGHTDSQGAYAHNLELSQKRAEAIVHALSADYGIDARRLIAKGVASVAPAASNDTEGGRAKNRRVELVKQ